MKAADPRRACRRATWTLAVACVFRAAAAAAALGGDAASVEADRTALEAAAAPEVTTPAYSIVELRTASGTLVREFLSPAGRVFAVAWSGPALPDLRQLLGGHFDAYTAALRAQRPGAGRAEVRENDLVVQSGGQMRNFFGRAYLRSLMPQGVTADDLN
jgi:hypothetical protein